MADFQNLPINPQGEELLKLIEAELPRMKLRKPDSYGNQEYEPNKTLDAKVNPLKANLQLSHLGHTVWRISKPIRIKNQTGPGYLIPIRVSGNPSLNPGGPQQPGSYTHYLVDTDLTPELDCIFLAKKRD